MLRLRTPALELEHNHAALGRTNEAVDRTAQDAIWRIHAERYFMKPLAGRPAGTDDGVGADGKKRVGGLRGEAFDRLDVRELLRPQQRATKRAERPPIARGMEANPIQETMDERPDESVGIARGIEWIGIAVGSRNSRVARVSDCRGHRASAEGDVGQGGKVFNRHAVRRVGVLPGSDLGPTLVGL